MQRKEFGKFIYPLEKEGVLEIWHDRKLLPGDRYDDVIGNELEQSDIIVLLVSQDFLASDYINEKELNRALDMERTGEATVVPVLIDFSTWQNSEFAKLHVLPDRANPVVGWDHPSMAWKTVAEGIRKVAEARMASTDRDDLRKQVGRRRGMTSRPVHEEVSRPGRDQRSTRSRRKIKTVDVTKKPVPESTDAIGFDFHTLAARELASDDKSLAPILVAIESQDAPIAESLLLPTERHMTVTLEHDAVKKLIRIGTLLDGSGLTVDEMVDLGADAWETLVGAQERLARLWESVRGAEALQPIAWSGHAELLLGIHRALLIATPPDADEIDGLLGFGDHYFHPLADADTRRRFEQRLSIEQMPTVAKIAVDDSEKIADQLMEAADFEFVIVQAPEASAAVTSLVDTMKSRKLNRTRAVLVFGEPDLSFEWLNEGLVRLPCISVAPTDVASAQLDWYLGETFGTTARQQAVPSLIAKLRRAWMAHAMQEGDIERFIAGLKWSTWSWVGRPLFARDFTPIGRAAYPHLTDLRSVARPEWNFPRRKGIPQCYQVKELAATGESKHPLKDRFHLYLSGAGGTGKSCFLRAVYDLLAEKTNALPVWYRVDAPNSDWNLVARRVREETRRAVEEKYGDRVPLPSDDADLGTYLVELTQSLKEHTPIEDVVVFIDQLERTFESGDQPELSRLSIIADEIRELLKQVQVGAGVRVFIASRKQYLPDFLSSFNDASRSGLHFNVLQTIENPGERWEFVKKIVGYCHSADLIDDIKLKRDAVDELTYQVNGHPLEIVLALVYLFSREGLGTVGKEHLEKLRPWERLFDFDIELARKDQLEWNFLLAMAHARAEIVGLEEVWWRLHMVDASLTTSLSELGEFGVIEWQWLKGHIGRTIHTRSGDTTDDGENTPQFLEFFHANLRDYLLRDVMSWAGKTPAAWRALDRLSAAAHEWQQTQRALDRDDIAALMAHREHAVEPTGMVNSGEKEVFYLLFVRDAEILRAGLCKAAKECFVFSALVNQASGRWAFQTLFPDTEDQISLSQRWLMRSTSADERYFVLQYLVSQDQADVLEHTRPFLAGLILAEGDSNATSLWSEIGQILAEPLNAARYRNDLIVAVIEALSISDDGKVRSISDMPERFRRFVTLCADNDKQELASLLTDCADRLSSAEGTAESLVESLRSGEGTGEWFDDDRTEASLRRHRGGLEVRAIELHKLELLVGVDLQSLVNRDAVEQWRAELVRRLGAPLPEFHLTHEDDSGVGSELEVRIYGSRMAAEDFFPPRVQVLLRDWERAQTMTPTDILRNDNEVLRETVVWVEEHDLRQLRWTHRLWTAENAVVDWLEAVFRRNYHRIIDDELRDAFLVDLEANAVDVTGISPALIGGILISLVRENVPVGARWPDLIAEMRRDSADPIAVLTRLREILRTPLSESFADEFGQLSVILVHPDLARDLIARLEGDGIEPREASRIALEASRHFERSWREQDVKPVAVCEPKLRQSLRRILEPYDSRVAVLSYNELSPNLSFVDAGRLMPRAADLRPD